MEGDRRNVLTCGSGSVSQREINELATADDILEVVQDRYGYTHHSPRSSAHSRHRSASGGVGEATTVRSLELSKGGKTEQSVNCPEPGAEDLGGTKKRQRLRAY